MLRCGKLVCEDTVDVVNDTMFSERRERKKSKGLPLPTHIETSVIDSA